MEDARALYSWLMLNIAVFWFFGRKRAATYRDLTPPPLTLLPLTPLWPLLARSAVVRRRRLPPRQRRCRFFRWKTKLTVLRRFFSSPPHEEEKQKKPTCHFQAAAAAVSTGVLEGEEDPEAELSRIKSPLEPSGSAGAEAGRSWRRGTAAAVAVAAPAAAVLS